MKATGKRSNGGHPACVQGISRARSFALIGGIALALVMTSSAVSADTAGDKALRGLSNMVAGVLAFPGEIHDEWNAGGASQGLTVGVAKGLGMIVARELVGVLELLTSPAPWPKSDFSPILKPEYPWEYFLD